MRALIPLVLVLTGSMAAGQAACERLSFPWSPWPLGFRKSTLPECAAPSFPPVPPPLPAPVGPPPPPDTTSGLMVQPYPLGDMSYDDVAGRFIATDGFLIAVYADLAYPTSGPVLTTFMAPMNLGGLTGIAADASAGVIWVTDGVQLAVLPLSNPTYTILPPVSFGFGMVAPPMTGLDRDPSTGDLVGCDQLGYLYRFDGFGNPVGAQPWRMAQPFGFASDVALRRHPSSRYSTLVQFRSGGVVVDYDADPLCPPLMAAFGLAPHGQGEGLALASAATIGDPARGVLQSGGSGLIVGTTRPPTLGSAPFACFLDLGLPFYPVYFMLDFAAVDTMTTTTVWPLVPLATPRWVLPFLPAVIVPTATDALGRAEVYASLDFPAPYAGIITYVQWAHPFGPPPTFPEATSDLSAVVKIELTLP